MEVAAVGLCLRGGVAGRVKQTKQNITRCAHGITVRNVNESSWYELLASAHARRKGRLRWRIKQCRFLTCAWTQSTHVACVWFFARTHTHTHAKMRTHTCANARAHSEATGTLLLHVLTEHARNKRSQKSYSKKNVKGLLRIKTLGSGNTSATIHLVNSIRPATTISHLFKPPAVTLH